MTIHTATAFVTLVMLAASAAAQTPRPVETRSVTLSLSEYNRLLDLASQPASGPVPPPVPAVLASADLRVRVDAGMARGTFTLAGAVLREGISRVNLVNGATLVEASLSGKPLPLAVDGPAHAALLPGPGPFSVTIEWGAPLAYAPGRASFVLPVPPAGTTRATFDLPGDQADVRLSGGLITRRTTDAGRTLVEATLDPGTATEVWWHMRDSAPVAAAREVRTVADVMTLISLAESDARMVALVDLTVLQGEPRSIELQLPAGYELTNVSGISLESREPRDNRVMLFIADPALRRHQFLVTLERPHAGGSFSLDTEFVSLPAVQRERGEVAVEGVGTLELTAAEREGVQRIDVRELNTALQSLTRQPMLAAFRYHRGGASKPGLSLAVRRFDDAGVLAAIAEHATATTLITAEGRALTEVTLRLRNRAQPFMKVELPAGAAIVSVEVAGEAAKPVLGTDGTRIPLLRPNFRPQGQYSVSFVYMHAGTPFEKKGTVEMTLPRLDVPIAMVDWEVFVPQQYSVRETGGNVIDRRMPGASAPAPRAVAHTGAGSPRGLARVGPAAGRGQVSGRAVDQNGAPLPGATVTLAGADWMRSAVTGRDGRFSIAGVPAGQVNASAFLVGFAQPQTSLVFDEQSQTIDFVLPVNSVAETVTVTSSAGIGAGRGVVDAMPTGRSPVLPETIVNLQRRAEGVLPIRVDVPRAGTSFQFVKPLVLDGAAMVTLTYKRR
jgi:hypothetical protein